MVARRVETDCTRQTTIAVETALAITIWRAYRSAGPTGPDSPPCRGHSVSDGLAEFG